MKVGIAGLGFGPTASGTLVRAGAQAAEQAGFSTCWFGEHAVQFRGEADERYPDRYDPRRKSVNFMVDPTTAVPDAIVAMTWAAAVTERIEIGSNIIILPQHQPVVLAKALASLDAFSEGRVAFGAGSGWAIREYEATGADWSTRGERMDEYVDVLRVLLRNSPASFAGTSVHFKDAYLHPRPAHDIPFLFGGESKAARMRVARLGDGWLPARLDLADAPEIISDLREWTKAAGRDPDALRIIKSITIWDSFDDLARYRDAGVTEFKLSCFGELPSHKDSLVAAIVEWGAKFVETAAKL